MFRIPDGQFLIWIRQFSGIVQAEMHKIFREPSELFIRVTQSYFWVIIFGQALSNLKSVSIQAHTYLDYMFPGIAAQSILYISIFYGLAVIWEKDLGTLHKVLVSPAPRLLLVLGRGFVGGIRGLSQVIMLYLLPLFLPIQLRGEFLSILLIILLSLLIGGTFSVFSMIIAALVKRRERFIGIGQAMVMPLFFISNSLYPLDAMPHWVKLASLFNPLTYQVDALRSLMIADWPGHFPLWIDFSVAIAFFIGLVFIAKKLYPKILY